MSYTAADVKKLRDLTGAGMIWLGTLVVVLFLNVKHEALATDEVPEGVSV